MNHPQPSRRSARPAPWRALPLAAAIVFAAAAAFTLPIEPAGAQAKRRKAVTHTVVMEGTSFEPAALTVTLGDTIEWVNRDFFPHTATAGGVFDSAIILAGKSWTYTPQKKGEIEYVCTLHPTMTGTLTVK